MTYRRHLISKLMLRLIQTLGESANLTKINQAIPRNDEGSTGRRLGVAVPGKASLVGERVCWVPAEAFVKSRHSKVRGAEFKFCLQH